MNTRYINNNNIVNGKKISPKRFYRNFVNKSVAANLNKKNYIFANLTYEKMRKFKNNHVYIINEYGIRISVDFRTTSHKIFSLCLDEMFMFDFDYKDFGYNGKNKQQIITNITYILLQYIRYVEDTLDERLAFKLYETDRGIHAYCITHRSGIGFPLSKLRGLSQGFIKNSVLAVGSNVSHFAYSKLRGACIRLVPKLKRKHPENQKTIYNSMNNIHNLSSKFIPTNFVSKPLLDENKNEVIITMGNHITDPYLMNLIKFKDALIAHLTALYGKYGNMTNGVALGVLVKSNMELFDKVKKGVLKIYTNFMDQRFLKNIRKPANWEPKQAHFLQSFVNNRGIMINGTKNYNATFGNVFLKSEAVPIIGEKTGKAVGYKINKMYNLNTLLRNFADSKKRFISWNDIYYLPNSYFKNNIIAEAYMALKKLKSIYNSSKLNRIEYLLLNVKNISNTHKIVCHVGTQSNLRQLRNSCAGTVLELNDFLKSKNNNEIARLLKELDELYDVCTEGTCESIQQFINEQKGGFNFVYNSKTTKNANINNAAIAVVKNMCATSSNLAEFKAKFENIVTVLRDKLIDKNTSNGKIDYMDIENYVRSYAAYLPASYCDKYNNNSVYKVLTINGLINLNV